MSKGAKRLSVDLECYFPTRSSRGCSAKQAPRLGQARLQLCQELGHGRQHGAQGNPFEIGEARLDAARDVQKRQRRGMQAVPDAADPSDFVGFCRDDVDERTNLPDELRLLLLKGGWRAGQIVARRRLAKRLEYLLLRCEQLIGRGLEHAEVGRRPEEDRHHRPNPNSHQGFERAVRGELEGMARLFRARHDDHRRDEGSDEPHVVVLALHPVGEVAQERRGRDEDHPAVLRIEGQDQEPGKERNERSRPTQHALVERLSVPLLPDHRNRDRGPGRAHPSGPKGKPVRDCDRKTKLD